MNMMFKRFLPQSRADLEPQADFRRISIEADPTSTRATRFRSVAQDVLSAAGQAKVIAVVPIAGGNPARLLANLSYAMAETRHSVCLVEADVRTPRLASVFDLPSVGLGLAEVLEGQASLQQACRSINPYLAIVSSDSYYGDIIGLLASPKLNEALQALCSTFATTLVLCPSAADYQDYRFISRMCDVAIIVAEKDKCTIAAAAATKSQLDKLGLSIVYALLSKS